MPPRIPDQTRTKVLELHATGMTCNAIARQLGISASSVSTICKANGRTFGRSQTKRATEAKQADLAALHTSLALKMAHAAHETMDAYNKPYLVYNFGGADNSYNEHTLDTPPAEVRRNMMTTAGIAFDKITKARELAGETKSTEIKDFFEGIQASIRAFHEVTTNDPDTESPPDGVTDNM